MKKLKKFLSTFIVGFVLVLIFLPRFWNFWELDFTGDEATHVKKAISVSVGIKNLLTFNAPAVAIKNIYVPILEHNHPPLEFLILIPFGLVDPREFSARFVYVVFNCMVLISSYLFLRKYIGKKLATHFFIYAPLKHLGFWYLPILSSFYLLMFGLSGNRESYLKNLIL